MDLWRKLELQLNDVFGKKAPQLSPNAREGLVKALPVLALIVGLLQLWGAYALWHLGHITNRLVDIQNSLSNYYGDNFNYNVPTVHLGFFYYLSLVLVVINAVVILGATFGLRERSKARGWNLLYYVMLLNVVYGVFRIFTGVGGGIGALIWSLIGSAVGAYFLFQIRDKYNGVKHSVKLETAGPTAETPVVTPKEMPKKPAKAKKAAK
jgi:hypothetical protein